MSFHKKIDAEVFIDGSNIAISQNLGLGETATVYLNTEEAEIICQWVLEAKKELEKGKI